MRALGLVVLLGASASAWAAPTELPRELDAKPGVGLQALWTRAGEVRGSPDGEPLGERPRSDSEIPLQVVGGTLDRPRVLLRMPQFRVLVYLGEDALAWLAQPGALLVPASPVPAKPSWSTPGVRLHVGRPVEIAAPAQDGVVTVRYRDEFIEAEGVVAEGMLGLTYTPVVLPKLAPLSPIFMRISEGAEILDSNGVRIAKVLRETPVTVFRPERRGERLIQLDVDGFSAVGWVKRESLRVAAYGRRSRVPRVTIGYPMAGTRAVLPRGTRLHGAIGGPPIGVVNTDFSALVQRGPGAGWHRYKVDTAIGEMWLWARVPVPVTAPATARP